MNNTQKQLIYSILVQIKPTGYYKGFRLLVTIIETILESGKFEYNLQKDIYPIVAKVHCCNPKNIERNIRTLLLNIDMKQLFSATNTAPITNPTVKTLIDILVTTIKINMNY